MRRVSILTGILLSLTGLVALSGCSGADDVEAQHHTAGLDEVDSLDVYEQDDTLHVLTAGAKDGEPTLTYTRSEDGGKSWQEPVTVDTGKTEPFGMHRGNDVQIAADGDGHLVAVWGTAGDGFGGTGHLAIATSDDGGQHWKPGHDPADDDQDVGYGFADMAVDEDGNFHLVWLDSRSGEQALYHARSSDHGRHWGKNRMIDDATCECCWNSIQSAAGRLFVLYRDIEPRDMAMATADAGTDEAPGWQQQGALANFEWYVDACPHTGGGLTADEDGQHLHAVVWTGKKGQTGLHHMASDDGGEHWSEPHQLGDDQAQHGDIAMRDKEHVAATWDAMAGKEGNAIFFADSTDGGDSWQQRQLHLDQDGATHPRILSAHGHWHVFWTQQHDGQAVWVMVRRPAASS